MLWLSGLCAIHLRDLGLGPGPSRRTWFQTTYGAEVCPGTAFPFLKCRARSLVNPAVIHEKH